MEAVVCKCMHSVYAVTVPNRCGHYTYLPNCCGHYTYLVCVGMHVRT